MTRKQKRIFTGKRKILAAKLLARKIGYLKTQDFPLSFFENLPTQVFNAHKVIRPKDELFIIRNGVVEIWHSHHDILVTELGPGSLFGDMRLLGQTMLGCQAVASSAGVEVGVAGVELITERIKSSLLQILGQVGSRLALIETEHYRAAFQTVESRLAGLLLELAGGGSSVEGFTHEELAEHLGAYRETVTNALVAMRSDRLIVIDRKSVRILDKRALQELSEL